MFFHGSKNKIDKFVDDFIGGEEAIDQEGPGIYFTTSFDDAKMYGDWIHTVTLSPDKVISDEEGSSVDRDTLLWLAKQAPDWEMHAQNWAEDPESGVEMAIDDFIEYNHSQHQQFQQVWYDFFRYDPIDYARAMSKLGYDAVYIDKVDEKDRAIKHAVVLNPSIITHRDTEYVGDDKSLVSESTKNRLQVLAGIKKSND